MIAKGVRFNAEKKQVGNYYSTKVCWCLLQMHLNLNYFSVESINCIILVFNGGTSFKS